MTAAKVDVNGKVTRLVLRGGPPESIQTKDVQDPTNLATVLNDIRGDINDMRKDFAPRHIDFEDFPVSTAGASLSLYHGFGGRVRWWLVDWQSTGTSAPILKNDTTKTDLNTLVLLSYVAGTATIRVEEAG